MSWLAMAIGFANERANILLLLRKVLANGRLQQKSLEIANGLVHSFWHGGALKIAIETAWCTYQ